MEETKKYYWLRLKRDFFKRHDTRIIESMENGEKYILFYLKLLVESIDHTGSLRFSDTVPYNESMLSVITNTDVDIVRSAVKIFTELEMMEQLDDGTYFMNHVNSMIGSETEWAEKKRIYREDHKLLEDKTMSGQKKTMSDKSYSKRESNTNTSSVKNEIPEQAKAMATLLYDLHKSNIDPEYTVPASHLESWASDIEKLNRIDKRGYDEIERIIRIIKTPDNFWAPNIMSGKKLRDKFPTLVAKYKPEPVEPVEREIKTVEVPPEFTEMMNRHREEAKHGNV